MTFLSVVRKVAKQIMGPDLTSLLRRRFRSNFGPMAEYRSRVASKRCLEIGGPSALFTEEGPIPIYDALASLDNCLYSTNTLWSGEIAHDKSFIFHAKRAPGVHIISEASRLERLPDSSYDCILASHCLEHIANPIRALYEWKRVLRDEGVLLLVLPHKDGTFDWRRPVTPLAHMIDDFKNDVEEDDSTHLAEVLALHDLSRDKAAGSMDQFRDRCSKNFENRTLHHHVFDTMSGIRIVNHVGFEVVRVDRIEPYHIVILARLCSAVCGRRVNASRRIHDSRRSCPDQGRAA
jgi:SAM-dependent methyltransferase